MSTITASREDSNSSTTDDNNLYAEACDASAKVDALTPSGRLLPANQLRQQLGILVSDQKLSV